MGYTKFYADWKNAPDNSTPITEAALDHIEDALVLASPSYATTLPGTPSDGQQHILVDSLTAPTWQWHLLYVAAKASNKWIFLGGAALFNEVTTEQGTTGQSYVNLGTVGPAITLPYAGDYFVSIGAEISENLNSDIMKMSYAIGATAASDDDALTLAANAGAQAAAPAPVMRPRRKNGLTAVTLTAKYRMATGQGNTGSWKNRWMRVEPIAIGG